MSEYFRAVAIDYDGTLTEGDRPSGGLLEALGEVRSSGRKLVLVTGRIVAELRRVFPDFADWFDVVVAENGAVLHRDGVSRALTGPVPFELDEPLVAQGVTFRRGQVLLDCDAEHELRVFRELRRIGSDCQLVRNRGALMVLPAGISKGTGLFEALGELGISHHSTIGIGDAENDLSLLEQCELGVAVGNALANLKQHADVVLTERNGRGVEQLLRGPLLRDELLVEPKRWQVELGRSPDGESVRLPASQVSVLVTGGTGAGKSYAAGLLAERLIELGYSVCIFDPEGDHVPLARLRGVVSVGTRSGLPLPEELPRLIRHRLGSLVVDLSLMPADEREPYLVAALQALHEQRRTAGVPHWVFIDEAHVPLREGSLACEHFDPEDKGFCLVTYRPEELCGAAGSGFDFLLAVSAEKGLEAASLEYLEGLVQPAALGSQSAIRALELGQAVLVRLGPRPEFRVLNLGARWSRHVRHWHKYASSQLPEPRRFYFRNPIALTGAVAANLSDFHRELLVCSADVVEHHLSHGDFSRWLERVVQDVRLAAACRSIEASAEEAAPTEALRRELLEAIEARYLE
ncbi:MAG: HAD hydrolase family protein [Myxococcota bacterium]|nr:HAD hydrolase family protein [Myxococcota bacterium]